MGGWGFESSVGIGRAAAGSRDADMLGGGSSWDRDRDTAQQQAAKRGGAGGLGGLGAARGRVQPTATQQPAGRGGAQKTLKTLLTVEGALRNQHTARRFISDLENERDDAKLLHLMGQGKGLERLSEICSWPHLSIDAGKSATLMSFQRVVVPLLRLITRSRVTASPLSHLVNSVYERVHGAGGFSQKLVECLQKLQASMSMDDPNGEPEENCSGWVPTTWIQVAEPVALYVGEVLERVPGAVQMYDVQRLLVAVKGFADEFMRRDKQAQRRKECQDLVAHLEKVRRKIEEGTAGDVNRAEARPDRKGEARDRESVAAATSLLVPFSGEHDNDLASITDISILPTTGEHSQQQPPSAPALRAEDKYHVAGVARLIDTRFRTARHAAVLSQVHAKRKELAFPCVRVSRLSCTARGGVACVLELGEPKQVAAASTMRRLAFWERSRRLAVGSLACLKRADGGLLAFGKVTARSFDDAPSSDLPTLAVTLNVRDSQQLMGVLSLLGSPLGQGGAYVVEACEGFQEQEQVLRALQDLQRACAAAPAGACAALGALETCQGGGKAKLRPPQYLSEEATHDLRSLAAGGAPAFLRSVRMLDTVSRNAAWEALCRSSVLYQQQLTSLMAALRKELFLVLGGPRTGKTTLAAHLVPTLLSAQGSSPVVYACATEGGLDAFLDALVHQCGMREGVVRLGGGSKRHEALSLTHVRAPDRESRAVAELRRGLEECGEQLAVLSERVARGPGGQQVGSSAREQQDSGWGAPLSAVRDEEPAGPSLQDLAELMRAELPKLWASLSVNAGTKKARDCFDEWVAGGCKHNGCGVHGLCLAELRAHVEDLLSIAGRDGIDERSFKNRLEARIGEGFQLTKKGRDWNFKRLCELMEVFQDLMVVKKVGDMRVCVHRDLVQNPSQADTKSPKLRVRGFGSAVLLDAVGGLNQGDVVRLLTPPAAAGAAAAGPAAEGDEIVVEGGSGASIRVSKTETARLHATQRPLHECLAVSDAWSLSESERSQVLAHLAPKAQEGMREALAKKVAEYERKRRELMHLQDKLVLLALADAHVVALSLEAASDSLHLLSGLTSNTVILDQAGMIEEAQLLAALSVHTKHLVLLGDHVGHPSSLLASLARRKDVPSQTLVQQKGFSAKVSALLRGAGYSQMQDPEEEHLGGGLWGLSGDVQFVKSPRDGVDWEIGMACWLSALLVRLGARPGTVCVVVPSVRDVGRAMSILSGGVGAVVDHRDARACEEEACVQGDEWCEGVCELGSSKGIRVISAENAARYGGMFSFAAVALPRQQADVCVREVVGRSDRLRSVLACGRDALVLFGSLEAVSTGACEEWASAVGLLEDSGGVVERLTLQCGVHRSSRRVVASPEELAVLCREGGSQGGNALCEEMCDAFLPCGHGCKRRCHTDDREHIKQACSELCTRTRPVEECACQHSCPSHPCGTPCGPCMVVIPSVVLPCGHAQRNVFCSATADLACTVCGKVMTAQPPMASAGGAAPDRKQAAVGAQDAPLPRGAAGLSNPSGGLLSGDGDGDDILDDWEDGAGSDDGVVAAGVGGAQNSGLNSNANRAVEAVDGGAQEVAENYQPLAAPTEEADGSGQLSLAESLELDMLEARRDALIAKRDARKGTLNGGRGGGTLYHGFPILESEQKAIRLAFSALREMSSSCEVNCARLRSTVDVAQSRLAAIDARATQEGPEWCARAVRNALQVLAENSEREANFARDDLADRIGTVIRMFEAEQQSMSSPQQNEPAGGHFFASGGAHFGEVGDIQWDMFGVSQEQEDPAGRRLLAALEDSAHVRACGTGGNRLWEGGKKISAIGVPDELDEDPDNAEELLKLLPHILSP